MSDGINKDKPTFILGLGVAKAGSSWLYRYLNSYSSANFGPIKEYEFFMSYQNKNFYQDIKERYRAGNINKNKMTFNMKALKSKKSYFGYFKNLINKEVRITGDISPPYANLTKQSLKAIKNDLEDAGFKVKVILIMRDPVNRIFSEVNMIMNYNPDSLVSLSRTLTENVNLYYKTNICKNYSEYEKIIKNIEDVFDKKNFLCLVYEEMFSESSMLNLGKFLNLYPKFEYAKVVANKSSKYNTDDDPTLVKKMLEFYQETYSFCYKNFPETVKYWRSING